MEKEINAQEVQVNAADGSIVDSIESKIFNIRGKQVMLDRDLAVLYGNGMDMRFKEKTPGWSDDNPTV